MALEPIALPVLPGPVLWRALAAALRRVTCSTRLPACTGCPLTQTCAYPVLAGAPAAPRPGRPPALIVQPTLGPVNLQPGDSYTFGVVLLGPAADSLPLLALALEGMGRHGLGTGGSRGRFRLHGIAARGPGGRSEAYDPVRRSVLAAPALWAGKEVLAQAAALAAGRPQGAPVQLHLLSPLRLRSMPARLRVDPASLVGELASRLWWLVRTQEPARPASGVIPDLQSLVSYAAHLTAKGELRWQPWDRPTGRTGIWTDHGGVVGTIILRGVVEPLFPLLLAGQYTHVGLYAHLGFGQYRVVGDIHP